MVELVKTLRKTNVTAVNFLTGFGTYYEVNKTGRFVLLSDNKYKEALEKIANGTEIAVDDVLLTYSINEEELNEWRKSTYEYINEDVELMLKHKHSFKLLVAYVLCNTDIERAMINLKKGNIMTNKKIEKDIIEMLKKENFVETFKKYILNGNKLEEKNIIEEVEVILTQEDKAEILREYAVNGNNFREAFRAVRTKQNVFDEKIKEEIETILLQDDCLEILVKYFLNGNDFKKAFEEARKVEEITIEENEIKLVAKEFDETTGKCVKYVVDGTEENYIEKYEYGWIVHFENKCYVKTYKYLKNAVKALSDKLK